MSIVTAAVSFRFTGGTLFYHLQAIRGNTPFLFLSRLSCILKVCVFKSFHNFGAGIMRYRNLFVCEATYVYSSFKVNVGDIKLTIVCPFIFTKVYDCFAKVFGHG